MYDMTWEILTLNPFRYGLCSLHNDMGGSYERCSRQNHGEGGKGKQAKSVQHLNFFNVIHFNVSVLFCPTMAANFHSDSIFAASASALLKRAIEHYHSIWSLFPSDLI